MIGDDIRLSHALPAAVAAGPELLVARLGRETDAGLRPGGVRA